MEITKRARCDWVAEISVGVGFPKPLTSGECVKAVRAADPTWSGISLNGGYSLSHFWSNGFVPT